MFPEVQSYWDAAAQPRLDAYDRISLQQHPDVLKVARHRVQAEIASLRRLATSFESKLNQLSPVHMLPDEILAYCFRVLGEVDALDRYKDYRDFDMDQIFGIRRHGPGRRLRWIQATHVCKRWRRVALEHSILWRRPAIHLGVKWFNLLMERAKMSPLHFEALQESSSSGDSNSFPRYLVETVLENIQRVELLNLAITKTPDESGHNPMLGLFSHPAPALKYLTVNATNDAHQVGFPSGFLGGIHSLEILTLYGMDSSWSTLPSGRLVFLKISSCSSLPSYDSLLDFLFENPGLQEIHLDEFCLQSSLTYDGRSGIRLPCLRHLTLGGLDTTCANILHALQFPATSCITLSEIYWTDQSHCQALFTELECHWNREDMDPFFHLRIDCAYHRFAFAAMRPHYVGDSFGCDAYMYLKEPSFSFSTAHSSKPSAMLIVNDLFDHIPLSMVQTIIVQECRIPQFWVDGLSRLRHIHSIRILKDDYSPREELFSSLSAGDHTIVHDFPELKTMEIMKTNLSSQPTSDGRCYQAELLSLLVRRAELQPSTGQLERLRLTECTVSIDNIWRLEVIVSDVEVIGGQKGDYFDGKKGKDKVKTTRRRR